MDYLWWYVPVITSPMLIALIATIHVIISHYAVGGGLFLAWELTHAYREKNEDYINYLHSHAKFFVLLTVVMGAITGVGIWWTIGLASPLATEMLINIFVFGWATEWVYFVVELVAAFLFLYLWGTLPRKQHLIIGWIYALAALCSLIIITGITGFMLHPGEEWLKITAGETASSNFFAAFLNPQFLPQTLARTGAALVLTGVYVLLHASITLKGEHVRLRRFIVERAGQFTIFGILIAIPGIIWTYSQLPDSAKLSIFRAAALTIFTGIGAAAGGLLLLMLLLVIWKPHWLSPVAGIAMFCMALGALACGEFVREAVRKPYVVYDLVLSNQILKHKVPDIQRNGILHSGFWTRQYIQRKFPDVLNSDGTFSLERLPQEKRLEVGRVVFMHHCNDCHADAAGYSPLSFLASSRTRAEKLHAIKNLDSMIYNMPPWCGNDQEAELLADYLESVTTKYPFP
ncbi:MAG: cytochrome ubiquinol oxidase subunit I [Planctomycetia bacterium]|nr:cytochrome ubiquinol oxidase subunit I [Planctomycetia bacterium]